MNFLFYINFALLKLPPTSLMNKLGDKMSHKVTTQTSLQFKIRTGMYTRFFENDK